MSLRKVFVFLLGILIPSFAQAEFDDTTQLKIKEIVIQCEKEAYIDNPYGSTALIVEYNMTNNECLEQKIYTLINKYYAEPQSVIKKFKQLKKDFMLTSESINFENKHCATPTDCALGMDVIFPYSDYGEFLKLFMRRLIIIGDVYKLENND